MGTFTLNAADKAMIRLIVDRMHVSTPNRDVIAAFRQRFKAHMPQATPEQRHACYRYALKRHAENFREYCFVMGSH